MVGVVVAEVRLSFKLVRVSFFEMTLDHILEGGEWKAGCVSILKEVLLG